MSTAEIFRFASGLFALLCSGYESFRFRDTRFRFIRASCPPYLDKWSTKAARNFHDTSGTDKVRWSACIRQSDPRNCLPKRHFAKVAKTHRFESGITLNQEVTNLEVCVVAIVVFSLSDHFRGGMWCMEVNRAEDYPNGIES